MVDLSVIGKRLILLDPGHGGTDSGTICSEPIELHESEINLAIVDKLRDLLSAEGYQVHCTREADVTVSLAQRARLIADITPDIFISIHCNSADNRNANGTETFYRDSEDKILAENIQDELVLALGTRDRGVKHDITHLRKSLAMLNNLPVPSCLVEVAFMSNTGDAILLLDTHIIARAISAGIEQWFITKEI